MVNAIDNKNTIENLFRMYVKNRDGVEEFLQWLNDSGFYGAPASTKYHDNCYGGLAQHSLLVLNHLITYWCRLFGHEPSSTKDGLDKLLELRAGTEKGVLLAESIVITALCHDVCKHDQYILEMKRKKIGDSWQDVQEYVYNPNSFQMGHGEKSLFLTFKYIWLTDMEAQAIRYHMGGFGGTGGMIDQSASSVFGTNKLAFSLHLADMLATYNGNVGIPYTAFSVDKDWDGNGNASDEILQ